MIHRRSLLIGSGLALLVGALGLAPLVVTSSGLDARRPPRPPPEPITWTQDVVCSACSWQFTTDLGESHEEGGFDDWRLPTVDETLDAIQDGSWGTSRLHGRWVYWTSEKRGRWAMAVWIKTDANGEVIPSESGEVERFWNTSFISSKFVRP